MSENEGNSALFDAVQNNNERELCALISAVADVNITDNERKTALFYAVQNGNESVVRALIDAGADVDRTDNEGKTALFYADMNGGINIAKALVERGALVNSRDIYGRTPLFSAMKSQTLSQYLLEHGGNLQTRDNCELSILSYFIECTLPSPDLQTEMEKSLSLMKQGKNVFETIVNFVFCKFLCTTFGPDSQRMCEVLEISKKYIDCFGTEQLQTKTVLINNIIRLLQQEGHDGDLCVSHVPAVLDLLLKLVANPNTVDIEGNTAFHYATRLPFWGVSENIVKDVFSKLKETPNLLFLKNHNDETPLLFSLSHDTWKLASEKDNWSQLSIFLNNVCNFLLGNHVFNLTDTTKKYHYNAIHLILKLFLCLINDGMKKEFTDVALNLLEQILSNRRDSKTAINAKDAFLNSPLHYWAQLEPSTVKDSDNQNDLDFKNLLEQILKILRTDHHASLNQRNEVEETPLHVSKTWHAVVLLLEAGANPKDEDSCKRSPLILAARNAIEKRLLQHGYHLYPDVSHDEKSFWETALSKGLELWTVDENGESILSILIGNEDFALAKSLLEFAKEKGYLMSNREPVATNLLKAICEDKSTHAPQKIDLVEYILECRSISPISVDEHLRACCRIISESYRLRTDVQGNVDTEYSTATKKEKIADSIDKNLINDTVHWKIAEKLRWHGANSKDQTCLEIAQTCPPLLQYLLTPVDIEKIPVAIRNWSPVSSKHQKKLEKVARRQEFETIGSFWYHRDPLNMNAGTFTHVFVGLNIMDRREVAIKRAKKPEHKHLEEEILTLVTLADCKQVITYVLYQDEGQYFYVVLELMEGNLEEYLKSEPFDRNMIIKLFKDLLLGLKYMHSKNILRSSINPEKILFKVVGGKVCFKFANFSSSNSRHVAKFWIAPELLLPHEKNGDECKFLQIGGRNHSKESEIFSLGRVLLYCLYNLSIVNIAIDIKNINDNFNTWEKPPCPEATNLLNEMLKPDPLQRLITAEDALGHPWLWSKTKKRNFLYAVGKQPEFKWSHLKPLYRPLYRSKVLNDLDKLLNDIIEYNVWDDLKCVEIFLIKRQMKRQEYNTKSVAELVHFIRNVMVHVGDLPKKERLWVLEENIFPKTYPKLIMEVLQVIKKHEWHLNRKEIADVLLQE